jgi:hypothetical protein
MKLEVAKGQPRFEAPAEGGRLGNEGIFDGMNKIYRIGEGGELKGRRKKD